ncbi:MAG: 5-nitroimidazole antibiotic resistance protein NimA [Anaerolineales bacterium]
MLDAALFTPRRADRAVIAEDWIKTFLQRAEWGVLATSLAGQPFVNSNLFVYVENAHALYLHTAAEGRTVANLLANPRVCFTVGRMGRLLPAKTALNFSVEYASVMVFGTAQRVTDSAEAEAALQALLDKYFPHLRPEADYRPIAPEELARTAVIRVAIEHWSAKRKQAPEDFPGAFFYEASHA